ncbi:MAG TPA: hypothetical protein PKD26_16790 [Pyrinomonadaceae bacterium]|nr:hypothetical protein [Pyrinomonadaceae bacterium]
MNPSLTDIHRSVSDAEDLEDVRNEPISVGDVIISLLKHPKQIIARWNWKSAMMGALLRASFYFTVYTASRESWAVTLTAVSVELGFRLFTSGISGALVQSFRKATPVWLATILITVSLPAFGHSVEFVSHYIQEAHFSSIFPASENNSRQVAFAVSVLFSVISALFNFYIMRHGVLLVGAGEETQSLKDDVKKFPYLIIRFVSYIPVEILNAIREGRFVSALGIFIAFGLSVGSVLGFFRGKWSWAYSTAIGAWAILFFGTIVIALIRRFIVPKVKHFKIFRPL